MTALTLSGLFVYPVKSAAGISVDSAVLTSRGLACDRRWMVVEPDGRFMTQRRFPKMALIRITRATPDSLVIHAPDMPELQVFAGTNATAGELQVEVWGDRMSAVSCGASAQSWFTQFLNTPCQLVYMPESTRRPTDHGKFGTGKIVSFADAYPYLLLSEASLSGLNQKLLAKQVPSVPMDRFRPNLVIGGDCAPHAEDEWKRIRIGDVTFRVAKPCARCSVPNVDQATGQRVKEPGQTLATYRAWDKDIWFGQNLVQEKPDASRIDKLSVGDTVEVLGA